MWFRNLQVYRLADAWPADPAALDAALAGRPLQPCGQFDMLSLGWVWPRGEERFVHVVNRQILLALGAEQKLLPTAIVNQVAAARAAEIAARQGYAVGRKQLRDIRDSVHSELLPRAFSRRRTTWAWADPIDRWLVVDAASPAKADELLEALGKTLGAAVVRPLDVLRAASSAMTEWVASGEAPAGFTLDRDLELRAADAGKATVRYVRHTLEGKEIREHIAAGKLVTRLGMTWRDRISFVLTEATQIKRLAFLDILKENAEQQAENADEQFDLDFAVMSGELARLLADLVAALGGERAGD